LLDELERRPGFYVRRFNRRSTTRDCPHCDQTISYTEEKMVDTSLVVDLVVLGQRDAFDVAVVFSGDADVAPGLAALAAMGKPAWIATFGDHGLSRGLVRQAWSHLDLLEHIDAFAYPELQNGARPSSVPQAPHEVDREILRELKRAEAHFLAGGGFVGAHYFIHRWKGHEIPDVPEARRQAVQRLMNDGLIVTYQVDGKTALRSAQEADDTTVEIVDPTLDIEPNGTHVPAEP
ncbi:MAG: NYN domain-containing protein, partial [Pseudomonadota bacterium]